MPAIESNLLIKSSIPPPTGSGFKDILSVLDSINTAIDRIDGRAINISVNVAGGKAALNQLNQLGAAATGARGGPSQFGPGSGGVGGGLPHGGITPGGGPGGGFVRRVTTQVEGMEGEIDKSVTDTFQNVLDGFLVAEKITDDGARIVTDELDIAESRRVQLKKKAIEAEVDADDRLQKKLAALDARRVALVAERRSKISNNQQLGAILGGDLQRQGFTQGPSKTSEIELVAGSAERARVSIDSYTKTLADGSEQVVTFNTATGRMTDGINKNTQAFRDFNAIQKIQRNETRLAAEALNLQAAGFVQHKRTVKDVIIGQQQLTTSLTEFRRVTGSALTGNLQVELKKMNTRTGEMSTSILRANDAMRLLGDSVGNAVAKVALWTGATTLIFGAVAAIGAAVNAVKELEAGTILLARVGANFGENFNQRLEESRILTQDLIRESQILGTSAAEAQQAATIFARLGQTREQTLKSTRAALIASRIAELEVVDAARLLSAAQLQFNLAAEDLLPTLDSLNALSNNYRVTTDDLLQSISRAGIVFADTNSTLEELAAITATVSESTGRSGAEIGNAFKTIVSRLAAPETRGNLIKEIGLAAQDSEGKTKGFLKILTQLQIATEGLSEAERDAVLVQVAGARQLNVLRNAVNNVTDSVLAEALALRSSGGALSEAMQTSATLDAGLRRLQASLIALAESSGESFGPLLTDLVDATAVVVKFISIFDNIVIKVGLAVLAFFAMRFAIVKLSGAFAIAGAVIKSTIADLIGLGVAANTSRSAITTLSVAMTALNTKALLFTAGLFLIVEAMAFLQQKTVENTIAHENFIDTLDRTFSSSQRKIQATEKITDALNEQIKALERLQKAEKTPENERAKKLFEENIASLTGEGGVEVDITRNRQGEVDTIKLQADALNKLNSERNAEIKIQEEQIVLANEQKKLLLEQIADVKGNISRFTGPLVEEAIREHPELKGQEKVLSERLFATEEDRLALEELEKQLAEVQDRLRELKVSSLTPFSETYTKDALEARNALIRLNDEFDKNIDSIKIASRFPGLFGNELQKTEREIDSHTDKQRQMLVEFERLNKFDPKFENFVRNVEKVTEALEAARIKAIDLRVEGFEKVFGAAVGAGSDVFRSIEEQQDKLDFINNQETRGGPLLEGAVGIRSEIEAAKEDAKRLGEILQDDKLFNEGNREESQALANAIQKRIDQDLGDAREGEVKLIEEILDIEIKITEERKKQNLETQRALGLLSEEDKILLLRQAQFFTENPNVKINALDQFLADADTNKINQQFFGNRLQQGFDPAQQFDKNLLALGIGQQNPDLDLAQAELDLAFNRAGGRDEFIEGRLRDVEELARVQNQLRGQPVPNFVFNEGALDVNLNLDALDFTPLVDAFREVVLVDIRENFDAMVAEVQKIHEEVDRLKATKFGDDRHPQHDQGD